MNIILIDDDIRYLEELRKTVEIVCRTERIQAKISDTDDPREVMEDELWKKNDGSCSISICLSYPVSNWRQKSTR